MQLSITDDHLISALTLSVENKEMNEPVLLSVLLTYVQIISLQKALHTSPK